MTTIKDRKKTCALSFIGAEVQDKWVYLWYTSPTGDSTDSVVMSVECFTNETAQEIADYHTKLWAK
jgi:hypothetical protein